jgi:hypothetical protein
MSPEKQENHNVVTPLTVEGIKSHDIIALSYQSYAKKYGNSKLPTVTW